MEWLRGVLAWERGSGREFRKTKWGLRDCGRPAKGRDLNKSPSQMEARDVSWMESYQDYTQGPPAGTDGETLDSGFRLVPIDRRRHPVRLHECSRWERPMLSSRSDRNGVHRDRSESTHITQSAQDLRLRSPGSGKRCWALAGRVFHSVVSAEPYPVSLRRVLAPGMRSSWHLKAEARLLVENLSAPEFSYRDDQLPASTLHRRRQILAEDEPVAYLRWSRTGSGQSTKSLTLSQAPQLLG